MRQRELLVAEEKVRKQMMEKFHLKANDALLNEQWHGHVQTQKQMKQAICQLQMEIHKGKYI